MATPNPALVLGLNAFHGDSAAALLRDGLFAAGIEEERLNRIKHWAGFPAASIRTVLAEAGARLPEVAHVAISRDPRAHLLQKALFALRHRPGLEAVAHRLANHRAVEGLRERLEAAAGTEGGFRGRRHRVEHHRAHAASAFFCSPFEEAACLTVDGFGDFLSSLGAIGRGNRLEPVDRVLFPHSLGILYTAVTQFLGFPRYGDEYKVMGLASYGQPRLLDRLRKIVRLTPEGGFETDPAYFRHASEGVTMSWDEGEPVLGPLWSPEMESALGPARAPNDDLDERHHDIAASLQAIYEEAFFHRLNALQSRTGMKALCLAGGCAMNSVANGKILERTSFRDVFIQAAAGDAGTALGAAQYVWHQVLGHPRAFTMEHGSWGQAFTDEQVQTALRARLPSSAGGLGGDCGLEGGLSLKRHPTEADLVAQTADAIAGGNIVGWFQGRGEWGPRALGNRSILADPRRGDLREVLNARIKRRETFRPFAPSILEERAADYFEGPRPDPFMLTVRPVRVEKRSEIPAVTHVDGTGRLQTVSRAQNPRYWALIKAFEARTGVPLVLNTSFNENEPIVNTPAEALECFFRTRMDRLVMGDWTLARTPS